MLFKKVILSFFAVCLATAPLFAISAPGVVSQGQFDDGAVLAWQCEEGVEGKVKMLLVTPQGKKYMAELSCGESI